MYNSHQPTVASVEFTHTKFVEESPVERKDMTLFTALGQSSRPSHVTSNLEHPKGDSLLGLGKLGKGNSISSTRYSKNSLYMQQSH